MLCVIDRFCDTDVSSHRYTGIISAETHPLTVISDLAAVRSGEYILRPLCSECMRLRIRERIPVCVDTLYFTNYRLAVG